MTLKATMTMPDLSSISATVTITRWLVPVGTELRRGEPLLEVETDKAIMVVESSTTGTLLSTAADPGQEVPAGQVIATFEVDRPAEDPAVLPVPPPPTPAAQPTPTTVAAPPPERSGSFFARNRQAARPAHDPAEDAE
jgi:pyruvate/2-oxoglutarate dehydrogenase complex dihydrolipoamide acyltransferase (E2) component